MHIYKADYFLSSIIHALLCGREVLSIELNVMFPMYRRNTIVPPDVAKLQRRV